MPIRRLQVNNVKIMFLDWLNALLLVYLSERPEDAENNPRHKSSITTPPVKERRKPFFKKASG